MRQFLQSLLIFFKSPFFSHLKRVNFEMSNIRQISAVDKSFDALFFDMPVSQDAFTMEGFKQHATRLECPL